MALRRGRIDEGLGRKKAEEVQADTNAVVVLLKFAMNLLNKFYPVRDPLVLVKRTGEIWALTKRGSSQARYKSLFVRDRRCCPRTARS